MAKPYKQMIHGFRRLYSHQFPSNPSPRSPVPCGQTRLFNATPAGYTRPSNPRPSADPSSPNLVFSRLFSSRSRLGSGTLSKLPPLGFGIKGLGLTSESGLGFRTSFIRSLKYGRNAGVAAGFRKSVVDKPLSAVSSAFSRYREAMRLQMEAFWRRNYLVIMGAGAVAVCIFLWRIMFGVASTFIGLSEGMAKYGFLALATAIVAFTGMYFRARFTINPDKVYRIAMRKLNTSAQTLEVMGAPLAGTDVRAYVMSGGQPKLTNFKLKLGNKRCFLIFPIRGSERRGLVSVEVKKKKGQYDMKLLAVDIPMASGPDQRLFLVGDEQEYKVGGGLISELREPIVKAMAAEKEFEDLDQEEEKADKIRELQEEEQKNRKEELRELEKAELERQEATRDKPQN
ncbi:uncharacterized protein LOC141844244 [Curcuma longa]|uniref:uncharacterized protein LOC141844244 n=1 Tax=Curcuma longa TaxID=136217 RepID=UPI003D9EED51